MHTKRKTLYGFVFLLFLLIFQWFTYLYWGPERLKAALLTDAFGSIAYGRSDTVFVRDYYVSDCRSGDNNVYLSHRLASDENFIKKKLDAAYFVFASPDNYVWHDKPEENYRLVYSTWASRSSALTFHDFFRVVQTEEITVDGKYYYHKETTCYWCFFFWIKRFEYLESWQYCN